MSVITERDQHGDVLWTWAFPSVADTHRSYFIQKCGLAKIDQSEPGLSEHRGDGLCELMYGQHDEKWYYIYSKLVKHQTLLAKQVNTPHSQHVPMVSFC